MTQKQILAALAVVVIVVVGLVLYSRSNNDVDSTTDQANSADTLENNNDSATQTTTNTNAPASAMTPATDEPSAPDGNDVQVFEIAYDGKAFSPATLDIKNGDIVVFKNNSDKNFWPASGPHPQHTGYPEFDPKKPVAAGQSWQFKFAKTGAWGFHDHLNSSAFGKITVQ